MEKTGGQFPTEIQGDAESNGIDPDRLKLGQFQQLPTIEYQKDLHIASQMQNETRPGYYVLDGYVDIQYKDIRLQADHAEFDVNTKDLTASGNVVLDQEGQRITGDRLELNMDSKLGTMYNVFGYVPPQIFFWGEKLDKLGDVEYKLYNGTFTECSQLVPHWQLNTTSARMTINDYIHFKNFEMEAKKIPIFYSPYMMWPIKRERATGFLFPALGPNSRKGFYIGNSFFWAMGRSMDATFFLDHWAIRGWGGGVEYRYAESKESDGTFKYYYANDSEFGPQWTFNTQVNQLLPSDWRLAAIADIFSSFTYEQDVSNNIARSAIRSERGQGFLTKNWSYYSLNVLGDYSNTQFSLNHEVALYHTPEIEFDARSQKLGPTPLFWSLKTSFDALGKTDSFGTLGVSEKNQWLRGDLGPTISFPMTYLSWLTFTPSYGYRLTYYTKSLTVPDEFFNQDVTNDNLLRKYSEVILDLRGPNFDRIYDTPGMGYSQKWKHAIEPQITFHYLQNIDNADQVLSVDDVDDVFGTKVVTYGVTNILYAKRPVEEQTEYEPDQYQYYNPKPLEPPVESPWEFISWRLQQSYQFASDTFEPGLNPNLQALGPLRSTLRVNPSVNYNIDFEYDYDVHFKQTTNISIGATLRNEQNWYANLSYVFSRPSGFQLDGTPRQVASNQIRTNIGWGLWQNRLVPSGELDYDIENKAVYRASATVLYNDDCFTIGLEYRHFNFGDNIYNRNENQFTFYLSLPNIGSVVNFRSGQPPRQF